MFKKPDIMRTTALAASLVLAGAAIFGSAASAGIGPPRDPACDQRVANECVSTWQTKGWSSYQDCVGGQQCLECPPNYGYMCAYPGMYDDFATERGTAEPW